LFIGLLSLSLISASLSDGLDTLYPGYVINYNTPKDKADDHFASMPISGVGPETGNVICATMGLSINAAVSTFPPQESIYISNRTLPTFQGNPVVKNDGDSTHLFNYTNGYYWLGAVANCENEDVSTCHDSVEAEVSLWTTYNNDTSYHWPPYQLLNQRRTAKFNLAYTDWIYFWLTVTNDDLDSNGVFNLYMGCQFYSDGEDSAVQTSAWPPTAPWPNTTGNGTDNALYYYPLDPSQKNGWIVSSPWALKVGMWKIAAQNTINNAAKFTIKVGFNSPPVQGANMNASLNRVGLLTLIALCIMKHLFF